MPFGASVSSSGAVSQAKTMVGTRHFPACAKTLLMNSSEITAKIAKLHCRVYEVGISYYGRTYEEGKKIGWRDGFRALYCTVKYNLFR